MAEQKGTSGPVIGEPLTELPDVRQQQLPGEEHLMQPRPEVIRASYKGSGKLEGRTAIITGARCLFRARTRRRRPPPRLWPHAPRCRAPSRSD
jgi:hypothetical protein